MKNPEIIHHTEDDSSELGLKKRLVDVLFERDLLPFLRELLVRDDVNNEEKQKVERLIPTLKNYLRTIDTIADAKGAEQYILELFKNYTTAFPYKHSKN